MPIRYSEYLKNRETKEYDLKVHSLTPWFPPRHGGAFSTLNIDCESSRRDRDKRLKFKSRAYDFTSRPVHATFQILKTYS